MCSFCFPERGSVCLFFNSRFNAHSQLLTRTRTRTLITVGKTHMRTINQTQIVTNSATIPRKNY